MRQPPPRRRVLARGRLVATLRPAQRAGRSLGGACQGVRSPARSARPAVAGSRSGSGARSSSLRSDPVAARPSTRPAPRPPCHPPLAGTMPARPPRRAPRRPRTTRRHGGFSLVELVISLGILSVGIVGAMRVFPVGLQASARSKTSSRATMVAQRTIESLKLESCETLTDAETTVEEFTLTTTLGQPDLPHLVDPARLKALTTTVSWTQEGRPRALTFVTYVRCAIA